VSGRFKIPMMASSGVPSGVFSDGGETSDPVAPLVAGLRQIGADRHAPQQCRC
jgi:hypothetical protein